MQTFNYDLICFPSILSVRLSRTFVIAPGCKKEAIFLNYFILNSITEKLRFFSTKKSGATFLGTPVASLLWPTLALVSKWTISSLVWKRKLFEYKGYWVQFTITISWEILEQNPRTLANLWMTLLSDPEETPDNDPQNNDMQTKEGEGNFC